MSACTNCDTEIPDRVKFCPNCGQSVDEDQVHEDPLVGEVFDGRYKVLNKVASGGFGTIYRVLNVDLNMVEALKVLHPHVASLPKQIRRFRQDAQLLRELSRKTNHVPELHHFDQDRERKLWYFTLEFLDGVSLHHVVRDTGAFELSRAIHIMRQICTALTVAHEHDPPVVHRDLKPDNIFLLQRSGMDFVKVLDFGIAKRVGHDSLTDVGQGLGSYGYMPPEQYLGQQVDGRTDLFALGAMGYVMLTGHEPWLGREFGTPNDQATYMRMMDVMLNQTPVPIREAKPDLPADVAGMIMRLLERDAAARFPSAVELDKALERTQMTVGVPQGGSLEVESVPSGAAVQLRRDAAVLAKGVTPWRLGPLPSGEYELRIRAKHCQPAKVGVRIVENQTSHVEVPLERVATQTERVTASLGAVADNVKTALPWRWVALALAILVVGGGGAYGAYQLLKGPPVVTDGQFLSRLERGEVSSVHVLAGGRIEAVTGPEGETVAVDLAALGFQSLLRLVRDAEAPISAEGGRARVTITAESSTGTEPGQGISLMGEGDSCGPCPPGQELAPGWYDVGVDERWIVDSVHVRPSDPDRGVERLDRPYQLFLAGGLDTEIRFGLTNTRGRQLGDYLQAADRAIGMQDYEGALGQLGQAFELDASNARADSMLAVIGDELAALARGELEAGRLNQARSAGARCVEMLARHYEACREVSQEAIRRIGEREADPTPGPTPPPAPPPAPPPSPERTWAEDYTGFLDGGTWRFSEAWSADGAQCTSGSRPDESLRIQVQGGRLIATGAAVDVCFPNTSDPVTIDLAGAVSEQGIRLEGSRGTDRCTYTATRANMQQSGIDGDFSCTSGRSGSWRLRSR